MVLQHAVCFHKARDWICQKDQSKLTYQSLLSHCKISGIQVQTVPKGQGSITAATASASSIHTDALTTYPHWNKCNYMHPSKQFPASCQQCYAYGGSNHFTALCRPEEQETKAVPQYSAQRSTEPPEKLQQTQR